MTIERLTIRGLRARAVVVPVKRPLHTAGGAITQAPFTLVDLQTEEGPVGSAYLLCYTPLALKPLVALLEELGAALKGEAVAPGALAEKLDKTFRLLGGQGLAGMAASAIDMAAWDALGKAAGVPLFRLLGGAAQSIPVYNSNGLGIIGADAAGPEAAELAQGFSAIKVRLGYPDVATDLAVIRAVQDAVPAGTTLFSDYNQSLSVADAVYRVRALDGAGLGWIEEPTRFDDYAGHAAIREASRTLIQTGENVWGPREMAKALAAGASDLFMPDAGKIGGVTGWMRAVALAEPIGMPISSHLYPEVSVHLLSVTPTRHWMEYMDWAEAVLQQGIEIRDGVARPSEAPGIGIAWDEDAVARYGV